MKDLGWANAQGETERIIRAASANCLVLGHYRVTVNSGSYGTVHTTTCTKCGYLYHEDSGD